MVKSNIANIAKTPLIVLLPIAKTITVLNILQYYFRHNNLLAYRKPFITS